jgi:hypothetical protein
VDEGNRLSLAIFAVKAAKNGARLDPALLMSREAKTETFKHHCREPYWV